MNTPSPHPASFLDIALLWAPEDGKQSWLKTAKAFAADVGQDWPRVYKWIERNFIPLEYWADTIAAVHRRHGIELTLAELHAMGVAALKQRQSAKEEAA